MMVITCNGVNCSDRSYTCALLSMGRLRNSSTSSLGVLVTGVDGLCSLVVSIEEGIVRCDCNHHAFNTSPESATSSSSRKKNLFKKKAIFLLLCK